MKTNMGVWHFKTEVGESVISAPSLAGRYNRWEDVYTVLLACSHLHAVPSWSDGSRKAVIVETEWWKGSETNRSPSLFLSWSVWFPSSVSFYQFRSFLPPLIIDPPFRGPSPISVHRHTDTLRSPHPSQFVLRCRWKLTGRWGCRDPIHVSE